MSVDVVILAGGIGSRLWPVSNKENPKQFFKPLGKDSMLKMTVKRGLKIADHGRILIITNISMVKKIQNDLKDLLKSNKNILILPEPAQKNTTAAILFSVYVLNKFSNPDYPTLVMPSDHFIDTENFIKDINKAKRIIENKKDILLFGIEASSANTNFGYIKVDLEGEKDFYNILEFTEKPDSEKALKFIEEGNYFWNAGIFFFSKRKFLLSAEKHTSQINKFFTQHKPENFIKLNKNTFKLKNNFPKNEFMQLKSSPIDKEIMEKAENLGMIKASFSWTDAGTWLDMAEFLKNNNVNHIKDEINSSGNFAYSDIPITFCGVNDLIVVVNENGILVTDKKSSHQI